MKAKRRHELQENVLAGELGKVVEFLKKRGSHIATGALVLALAIFAYVTISGRSEAARLALQSKWDRATTGQAKSEQEQTELLTELAAQTDNLRMAALATVELGFADATRALVAKPGPEREALEESAAKWYGKTIADFPTQVTAVAKAHFGLGKLYESKGQFTQAAEEYQKAKASPEVMGHPVMVRAERSLAQLPMLNSPVRMATTIPATMPATAPTSMPINVSTGPTVGAASPPATQPAEMTKP